MILILFMLINPIYALVITVFFSIIKINANRLLVGILYTLSFALLFANQDVSLNGDLNGYLDMYLQTIDFNILDPLRIFLISVNSHEPLWWWYGMIIGNVSYYSESVFIVATYIIIFSLSAYLVYLVSERGKYNFPALLLVFIIFDLTFLNSSVNLWRIIIAGQIFLIGLVKYDLSYKNLGPIVLIYLSIFIHVNMVLFVIFFEIYRIFFSFNSKKNVNYLQYIFFIFLLILALDFFVPLIVGNLYKYKSLSSIGSIYLNNDYVIYKNINFSILDYLSPIYILIILRIFTKIKKYELYIIAIFLVLIIMQYVNNYFSILYSRSLIIVSIMLPLIAIRPYLKSKEVYILFFVPIFLFVVLYRHFSTDTLYPLLLVSQGDLFCLRCGIIESLSDLYDVWPLR